MSDHAISIHAPAKGATDVSLKMSLVNLNFNPRSREGSDMSENGIVFYIAISIHAPAKGATSLNKTLIRFILISIHAPAKGATFSVLTAFVALGHFNPRSREGSDDIPGRRNIRRGNFNPRSREGSDSN